MFISMPGLLHFGIPLAFTALGAVVDLRCRAIPDPLPLGLVVATALFASFDFSAMPLWSHATALLAGLGIGLAFAWSGGFGGGDVKLYAAVAGWFGLPGLLPLTLWIALAGLPLALIALARGERDFAYGPAIFLGTLVHTAAPTLLADFIH